MSLTAVVGMHRSGTSVVTGVLRFLGADVGPEEDLMEPKPENPKGFFEHLPLVRLNDRLLYRLGGTWDAPPALTPGWEQESVLDDLREEAQDVIRRAFPSPSAGIRLVKDPRLSLTLPLWRTVAQFDRVVLTLRPPDPTVRSLRRRDPNLSSELAADLYVQYLLAALHNAPDAYVISPAPILENNREAIADLAEWLGLEFDGMAWQRVGRFLEPTLWESRASTVAIDPCPELDLARWLHEAVVSGDSTLRACLGGLETRRAVGRLALRDRARIVDLEEHVQKSDQDLKRLRSERDSARERVVALREQRDRCLEMSNGLRAERDEARQLLRVRDTAVTEALKETRRLRAQLAALEEAESGSA